jgi:hypothetical protein
MNWKRLDSATKAASDIRAAYAWYLASDSIPVVGLVADLINKAVNDAHADVANALALGGLREGLLANKFESGSKDEGQFRFIFP